MENQYNIYVFFLGKNLKLNTEKWEKTYTKNNEKTYIL